MLIPPWLQYVWKWVEIVWIPVSTILGILFINVVTNFLGGNFEEFTDLAQWQQLFFASIVASIRPVLGAILAWVTRQAMRRGSSADRDRS